MTDTGKLYWSAIKTFGVDLQLAVAIEEMAELTKELCKAQRTIFAARTGLGVGRIDNLDEIAEEIADVQIALEELEQLYGAKKKVQKIRQQKLARLEMRIEKAREERGDNREHTAHWEGLGPKGDPWYAKLNGPEPDPKGAEGEPGQEGSIFQDFMDIVDGYMALKRAKEANQCGDASGRGND